MFAKEELKVKEKNLEASITDIPMMTFEVGFGNEKKTLVNYFYREFNSGVTGLNTVCDQIERLRRMTSHWKSLTSTNRDVICLGDANICSKKWNDTDYHLKEQVEIVQTFLLETESSQLVKDFTRSEIVQGRVVSRSSIDHIYCNAPGKVSIPEVSAVGNSDHLGVVITKYTRVPKSRPKVIMKRSYKDFNVENFLNDIYNSNINENVTSKDDVETAAFEFETTFKEVLDTHAPIKVFQTRRNYCPYISENTKAVIRARNSWKELAVSQGYKSAEKIAKDLGKEIKKAAAEDKRAYFNKDFKECCDRSKGYSWNK